MARLKKNTEHKVCVLIFSTTFSEIFLILRINERYMIKNVYWSSRKVPYSCPILIHLNFHTDFKKILKY